MCIYRGEIKLLATSDFCKIYGYSYIDIKIKFACEMQALNTRDSLKFIFCIERLI